MFDNDALSLASLVLTTCTVNIAAQQDLESTALSS